MDDFPTSLRRFAAFLRATGLSERTRSAYIYQLVRYQADVVTADGLVDLELEPNPFLASEDDLVAYLNWCPRNGTKRGDFLRAAAAAAKWAHGRIREDLPTTHLRAPGRRAKTLRRAPDLADHKLRAILRAAFRREERRGWALMLMLATGARIGAFCSLRPHDIDFDAGVISMVEGVKYDDPYDVEASRAAMIAWRHLSQLPRGRSARHAGTLLGVHEATVRSWLQQAARDAGLAERVWPHLLRHCFATRVQRAGKDPALTAALLNHHDLATVSRYVHVDSDDARRAVAAVI